MAADDDIPPIPTPSPGYTQAPVPPVAPPPYVPPGTVPPTYGAQPYAAPGAYVPAQPQGLSVASLITGIVGVLFSFAGFGLLPSVAAIVTGHLAQRRQRYARGLWLAGLITGYIGLAISVITIVVIVIVIVVAAVHGINSSDYSSY